MRTHALASAALLLLLTGCSGKAWLVGTAVPVAGLTLAASRVNPLYPGRYGYREQMQALPAGNTDARLTWLEADDQGWFTSREQPRAVLDTLSALAARGNVAVLVYVHGWRHNLSQGDTDVSSFRATITALGRDVVQDGRFRELRFNASGDSGTTLVGIHIGWRGKMWPECPPLSRGTGAWAAIANVPQLIANIPVYFTFWSRKSAAERIGHGDLSEFLGALDALYQRTNARSDRLMSLVVVGHSFGGHAVFDATRERLESRFATAIAEGLPGFGAPAGSFFYARDSASPRPRIGTRVRGFGDLVVLINPAIEADSYHRIDRLARGVDYPDGQQPILITVSARNDVARSRLFRIGRWFSKVGSRTQPGTDQHQLLRRALGSYAPQVTDDLRLRDHDRATLERARWSIAREGPPPGAVAAAAEVPAPAPKQFANAMQQNAMPLVLEELQREDEFITLTPRPGIVRALPARVIEAEPEVIDGHSDFFRFEFIRWLSRQVLDVQAERLREHRRARGK